MKVNMKLKLDTDSFLSAYQRAQALLFPTGSEVVGGMWGRECYLIDNQVAYFNYPNPDLFYSGRTVVAPEGKAPKINSYGWEHYENNRWIRLISATWAPTEEVTVYTWQECWHKGFVPQYDIEQLSAMIRGLEADDPRIIQGATCSPPPLQAVQDWSVEEVDIITYPFLHCGVATVGDTEEQFAKICFEADKLLESPADCRYFINWYDNAPRDEMRSELIKEIKQAILDKMGITEIDGSMPSEMFSDILEEKGLPRL